MKVKNVNVMASNGKKRSTGWYVLCWIMIAIGLALWRSSYESAWLTLFYQLLRGMLPTVNPFAGYKAALAKAAVVALAVSVLLWIYFNHSVFAAFKQIRWIGGISIKMITAVLAIIFFLFAMRFLFMRPGWLAEAQKIVSAQKQIKAGGRIIHAGGGIADVYGNEYTYTNSEEAINYALQNGQRFIEIDFRPTTDNALVCAHFWTDLVNADGSQVEGKISLDSFLQCKVFGVFNPVCLDDIIKMLKEHDDLYIIADTRGGRMRCYKMIAKACPDLLDRFIAQIYHAKQYKQLVKLGYSKIIYTLYKTEEAERDPATLCAFAQDKPLFGFTLRQNIAEDENYFGELENVGIPIYVHTVDEPDDQKKWLELGADAVYTNCVPAGSG